MRSIRTTRGGLYAFYAVFFFVEGIALMLAPGQTLQARHTRAWVLCACVSVVVPHVRL